MQREELFEGIDTKESITQKYLGLSLKKFFFLSSLVVILGIYLGILFYGTSSLQILFGLQDYEDYLHSEIATFKQQNAELQREYFELKEISAQ